MLRFMSKSSDDGFGFQCYDLTQKNGLVSLIIDESNTMLNGLVVIVENFDCFLSAEKFVNDADVVVYSNGRLGKKVITWLSQCTKIDRIVHMGDYDPVGLSEFIRIEDGSNHQTEFYFHPALDETIFRTYGKASLVSDSKNAKSLEKARTHSSSDEGFNANTRFDSKHWARTGTRVLAFAVNPPSLNFRTTWVQTNMLPNQVHLDA